MPFASQGLPNHRRSAFAEAAAQRPLPVLFVDQEIYPSIFILPRHAAHAAYPAFRPHQRLNSLLKSFGRTQAARIEAIGVLAV